MKVWQTEFFETLAFQAEDIFLFGGMEALST